MTIFKYILEEHDLVTVMEYIMYRVIVIILTTVFLLYSDRYKIMASS